jgi:hypothetical protein
MINQLLPSNGLVNEILCSYHILPIFYKKMALRMGALFLTFRYTKQCLDSKLRGANTTPTPEQLPCWYYS